MACGDCVVSLEAGKPHGKPQAGGARWAPAAQLALRQPRGSNVLGSICTVVWCGDTLSDPQTWPVFWRVQGEVGLRAGSDATEEILGVACA